MTKYASDALHAATHSSCNILPIGAYDLIGSEKSAKALGRSKTTSMFAKQKSQNSNEALSLSKPVELIRSTYPLVTGSPVTNGMLPVRLKPENELFIQFIKQIGPMVNVGLYCNDQYFSEQIKGFQYTLNTRQINEELTAWNAEQARAEALFDSKMKSISKGYKAFETLELYLPVLFTLSANTITYSKQQYLDQQKKDMIAAFLNECGSNEIFAVFSKWELTPQGQLALRLMFLLERQFIDDPVGLSNENAFIALQGNLEGLFNCKAYPVPRPLNGFMPTNRFFKGDPKYKDLIKLLKTYLVGTDTILRIWDTQSGFDVLYSKLKTN
ncbi:Uncharacterised protein [Acinetobacter baumannii]|uniref:hypothetical protein n=1 Tax=Acinetobacter calcoaceticus/baumannii complex TaxID=909768 RepID=UPI0002BC7250|nr:hypothetical protein [Acinetobacter baumannii]SSW77481.1 Uncharacterised protein [Klebsiella pneumoniae]EJB8488953.1 hypothetical protein [Acinetobacter baumannii]EKU0267682.1 hypothetical protein [Acinetobacter baumannii]EKW1085769.1 hypothetical protein [Acinetobacter baumannii]EKW3218785.1 hypothetical protein [Acinetobacter baumannii]